MLGKALCKLWLTQRAADRHYAGNRLATNLLPMDVAQEAHFSNMDTWDSCQDGKQIKDVSKQSAKTPQCGVFFFMAFAKPHNPYRTYRVITLNTALARAIRTDSTTK